MQNACKTHRPCESSPGSAIGGLWNLLADIRSLDFIADSRSTTSGYNGTGRGNVHQEKPPHTIACATAIWNESGCWSGKDYAPVSFSNRYKWQYNQAGDRIRLSHLRYGDDKPVYLFDLVSTGTSRIACSAPHICAQDRYCAHIEIVCRGFVMRWDIRGPNKDQSLIYRYSTVEEPG